MEADCFNVTPPSSPEPPWQPWLAQLEWGDFEARWEAAKALATYGVAVIDPLMGLLERSIESIHFLDQPEKSLKFPTKIQTELQAESQAESQVELQVELQTKPQVELQVELQTKPQVEQQAKPQAGQQTKPQVELQVKPQAESQAELQTKLQAKPQAELQTKPQVELKAEQQAEQQTEPPVELQTKPQTELQVEPRSEPQEMLVEGAEYADLDEELLWFIASILGKIAHPQAIAALVDLIQTYPRAEVSHQAAIALAQIGEPALPALQTLLQQDATRLRAVEALAQMSLPGSLELLLTVMDDREAQVRSMAIEGLSGLLDPRIPPIFMQALQDPSPQVRQAAIVGVGLRSPDLPIPTLVSQLSPLLYDLNLGVASQTALALGRIGNEAAVNALIQALQTPLMPLPLQMDLLRALGMSAHPLALRHLEHHCYSLVAHLSPDSDQSVLAREGILVLGRVDPRVAPQAVQILERFLQLGDRLPGELKQVIAWSLGQLGGLGAIESLVDLLKDDQAGVRFHAIAALKHLAPTEAWE